MQSYSQGITSSGFMAAVPFSFPTPSGYLVSKSPGWLGLKRIKKECIDKVYLKVRVS